MGKSVADGKNLIGSVVGGNSNSSFATLANNAQSIKNARDTWMNIANSKISVKTVVINMTTTDYGETINGSVLHGCNTTPKYVFALLTWFYDDDLHINNFFISNISSCKLAMPMVYYNSHTLLLSVDKSSIKISGYPNQAGDNIFDKLSKSNTCYVFY